LTAILALFLFFSWPALADEPPAGRVHNTACRDCHMDLPPGAHGQTACIACHGDLHGETAARARRNDSCIACHGGPGGPVGRSYLTSKHGVIAHIEGPRWDWSRPFGEVSLRTPTCAYCHVRGQEHRDEARETCTDCHSGRFVDTLGAAGRRALGIGLMKVEEAEAVVSGSRSEALLEHMKSRTLGNLRLGIVHQSPDYEWWHGQAALDGDLLRIKGAAEMEGHR